MTQPEFNPGDRVLFGTEHTPEHMCIVTEVRWSSTQVFYNLRRECTNNGYDHHTQVSESYLRKAPDPVTRVRAIDIARETSVSSGYAITPLTDFIAFNIWSEILEKGIAS